MSQQADWLIHDTMTYLVLSEEFREVTRQLAADAAARDAEGVNAGYGSMVDVCVRCHTYLRRERLVKDFPDKVSRVERWSRRDGAGYSRQAMSPASTDQS